LGRFAEIVVLTLEATGHLGSCTAPGLDPLATIQAFNEDSGQA